MTRPGCKVSLLRRGALLIAALVVCGGCAKWNWRGEGFHDHEGAWAQKMRPAAKGQHFSGLDERARDIERDLGVQ